MRRTSSGSTYLRELADKEPETNLFISPLSVSLALAMTYNGAEGETKMAMAQTLAGMDIAEVNAGYDGLRDILEDADIGVELAIANSIWSRMGFDVRPDFQERVRRF